MAARRPRRARAIREFLGSVQGRRSCGADLQHVEKPRWMRVLRGPRPHAPLLLDTHWLRRRASRTTRTVTQTTTPTRMHFNIATTNATIRSRIWSAESPGCSSSVLVLTVGSPPETLPKSVIESSDVGVSSKVASVCGICGGLNFSTAHWRRSTLRDRLHPGAPNSGSGQHRRTGPLRTDR